MTKTLTKAVMGACVLAALTLTTLCSAAPSDSPPPPPAPPAAAATTGGEAAAEGVVQGRDLFDIEPEIKDPADPKLVFNVEDPKKMLVTKIIMHAFVIVGVVIYFFELANGIVSRLEKLEEENVIPVRKDYAPYLSYTDDHYLYPYDNDYNHQQQQQHLDGSSYNSLHNSPRGGYYREQQQQGRPSKRSAPPSNSIFNWPFLSIDPVEATFAVLQMRSMDCRRRAICHLQHTASEMQPFGFLLQSVSPSVPGLELYREAQEAGAALQDCRFLFHCPWAGEVMEVKEEEESQKEEMMVMADDKLQYS